MKDLGIWNKAMELAKVVYALTNDFPEEEKYNLISQIRRSAISIPSNIAEGRGRETEDNKKEFLHFLRIAKGSTYELETQLILAKDLGFLADSEKEVFAKNTDLKKMLYGFIKSKTPIS